MPDAPTPLDLEAIRARLTMNRLGAVTARETDRDLVAIRALLDEVERLRDACKTLGGVIDQQCIDIAKITRSEHLVSDDGDADWSAIWDRGFELADRAEKAEAAVARLTARPAPAWDEEAVTEAVARTLHADACSEHEYAWEPNAGTFRDQARAVLAVVRDHLPVKPDREAVARALDPGVWRDELMPERPDSVTDEEWGRIWDRARTESKAPSLVQADAVLSLLPGRSEAEVKAEELRAFARSLEDEERGIRDAPDFNRHRDDFIGRINGLRTAARRARARADHLAAEGGADRG